MQRIVLFLLALVLMIPGASVAEHERTEVEYRDGRRGDRPRGDRGDRIQRLQVDHAVLMQGIQEELAAIDDLLGAARSSAVQREIQRKLDRITEMTAQAQEITERLGRIAERAADRPPEVIVVEAPPPPPEEVFLEPCPPGDFDALVRAVEAEPFTDGKLSVLRDAIGHRHFVVNQVMRMMDAMTFPNDKVEAAALMHPRTLDIENWYRVYSKLTFDSNKNELRKRVGG